MSHKKIPNSTCMFYNEKNQSSRLQFFKKGKQMQGNEKSKNIIKLVLAPIVYFILSQGVSVVYAFICAFKIGFESGGNIDDINAVVNQVVEMMLDKTMMLTLIGAVIAIPIMYFFFYDKKEGKCETKLAYFFVALLGVGACLTVNILISLSGLPLISKSYQELSNLIYSGNVIFEIITAGIIVPIAEELIFRGVLFKRLSYVTSTRLAVLISSLIFGVMHGNLVQFVYASVLGAIMCFVYIRCKNILAPILFHIFANTFSVLLSNCKPIAELMENIYVSLAVVVACVALAATTPIVIYKLTEKTKAVSSCEDENCQSEEAQQ